MYLQGHLSQFQTRKLVTDQEKAEVTLLVLVM